MEGWTALWAKCAVKVGRGAQVGVGGRELSVEVGYLIALPRRVPGHKLDNAQCSGCACSDPRAQSDPVGES